MSKLYFFFFTCLLIINNTYTMDIALPPLPEETVSRILDIHLLNTIPNQYGASTINNPLLILPTVRKNLVDFSLINKDCNERANNSQNVCVVINKFFQRFKASGGCKEIAEKINTPGSKNYITQSSALFSEDVTPAKIIELKELGADLDYTYSWHNNGLYNYPLQYWIQKNHLEHVRQLLKLGADVNKSYVIESGGPVSWAKCNPEMLALVLQYKPKNLQFPNVVNYGTDQAITMLLDAAKENKTTLQNQLNQGLQASLWSDNRINPTRVKLLLDEGAQPEYPLKGIISWMLRRVADPQGTRQTPSLEMLQTLCNYPITDMTKVEEVRNDVNAVKDMADNILAILNTCTKK